MWVGELAVAGEGERLLKVWQMLQLHVCWGNNLWVSDGSSTLILKHIYCLRSCSSLFANI